MPLDEYKTEHLVLLVGSNPLPNLVAAQVLLRPGGTLHLVYSSETLKITERLRTYLQSLDRPPVIAPILKVDPMNAGDIQSKIKARLREITSDSIGLHYTGGTKAMAVHAYREIEADCKTRGIQPVFSYLDKDTFDVRVDPDWHEPVLFAIHPQLEELATLHGAVFQKTPKRQESLLMVDFAAALAQSASDGSVEVWRKWCDEELRSVAYDGKDWRKKRELLPLILALPQNPVVENAVQLLKSALGISDESYYLPLDPAKLKQWPFEKREPKYLCKWLDGEWLEHYVLAQILAFKDKCQIHDAAMNLQTNPAESDFNFELDVAAIRGYQLFAISCTTDTTPHRAKSKLFEAFIRARQLAGDEARVGLVCGYEGVQNYAGQIVQEWFAKDKIQVFGPYDLPNLGEHLARWFKTAQSTKEAR